MHSAIVALDTTCHCTFSRHANEFVMHETSHKTLQRLWKTLSERFNTKLSYVKPLLDSIYHIFARRPQFLA